MTSSVVDTGGKFANDINDDGGGKFANSVNSRKPHNSMNAKKMKEHQSLQHQKDTNISGNTRSRSRC